MQDPKTKQSCDKWGIPHYGRQKPCKGKETALQMQSAAYLSLHKDKPLFTHVANERKTEVKAGKNGRWYTPEGSKLKRMGVKKGFPDLAIFEPVNNYIGLMIELKTEGGSLKKDQKNFLLALQERGYYIAVCWNIDAVKAVVDNYLSARFHWFTSTTL